MLRNSAINFVLKLGLGLTSLGFALYSLAYPNVILEFYPQFVPDLIGDLATLIIGSVVTLFMAVWIFSRRHKFACSFTFLILIFLAIIANLTSLRFVSVAWPLFIISLALSIRYYPRIRVIVPHKDGERMRIVPINDEDDSEKDKVPEEPKPVVTEAPTKLENDPAQTSEYLNSEKFVRGNKFFEGEQPIPDDTDNSEQMVSIEVEPPTIKPKRVRKPRLKTTTRLKSKKSANSEIHEEF